MIAPTIAPDALVDFCPRCQTTAALRRLHGPTAGPYRDMWRCGRCGLDAEDLANATEHAAICGPPSPGIMWERLDSDARQGRPVDPLELARQMGRHHATTWNIGDRDAPAFDLLANIAWQITGGAGIGWPNSAGDPWVDETPEVVAEMIVTALVAAGMAPVDALGADAPELAEVDADALADDVGTAEPGKERARALARLVAFGRPHGRRTGPDVPCAVLAALVDALRADPCALGRSDGAGAAAIIAALHAAGYALVGAP